MISDPHRNQHLLRLGRPLSQATAVVILLHGRGGAAEDMFSLGEELGAGIRVPGATGRKQLVVSLFLSRPN